MPKSGLEFELAWEITLPGSGIGGVAATEEMVVVSSRNLNDDSDVFLVLDTVDGGLITKHEISSKGRLDYGNSPRATPIIGNDLVYVLSAFGKLLAIDPFEGKVRWEKDFVRDFAGRLPTWGYCASPLLVDGQLIVQPGGPQAAIVSLDALTGAVQWQAANESPVAYASPIVAISNHNRSEKSIIACDQRELSSWSLTKGQLNWRIKPTEPSEFMVPTPLLHQGELFWLGELNGLRHYRLPQDPQAKPVLLAENVELTNDIQSPVSIGKFVAFVAEDLLLIDPSQKLSVVDRFKHQSLDSYALVLTEGNTAQSSSRNTAQPTSGNTAQPSSENTAQPSSGNTALVCCTDGRLLLLEVRQGRWHAVAENQLRRHAARQLAHPAWVNGNLYMRSDRSLARYRLRTDD